jgi:hypothetical protein
MRWVRIGQESSDDAGLCNYLTIEVDCGNETALNSSQWKDCEKRDELTGLISRYHGSLGLSKSIITSSYFNPNSFSTICARCAQGHLWFVYKMIFAASPLVCAMLSEMSATSRLLWSLMHWISGGDIRCQDRSIDNQVVMLLCSQGSD